MKIKRYNDYNEFAWIYNKHWGVQSLRMIPFLERILLSKLSDNAQILDLCCGAGLVVGALLEKKYDAIGLDGSEKLLEFAKENVPNGKFILADARDFKINIQFDAVISVFDSLNHILNIKDMNSVFNSVFCHLKSDGYFLFDLNVELGFNERWKNHTSSIIESDHVVAVQSDYDNDKKIGEFKAAIFRKVEGWTRSDVTLIQKCYAEEEILYELENVGFRNLRIIDTHKEFGTGPKGRPFFYAQKPNLS